MSERENSVMEALEVVLAIFFLALCPALYIWLTKKIARDIRALATERIETIKKKERSPEKL